VKQYIFTADMDEDDRKRERVIQSAVQDLSNRLRGLGRAELREIVIRFLKAQGPWL
jgi:hypothetical protein